MSTNRECGYQPRNTSALVSRFATTYGVGVSRPNGEDCSRRDRLAGARRDTEKLERLAYQYSETL